MTRNQLDDLISLGENNRLEFKRQLSSAYRIARTLAAFANSTGGTLLIGIADDGRIVGVPAEFREISKLEEATERLIEPSLTISYKTLAPDGRLVLIVNVAESDEKPHYVLDETGKRILYVRAKDKSVPTTNLIQKADQGSNDLLKTNAVRTLIQYLRKNDDITAPRFAKLVNISDYRAGRLLKQLAGQGLLIMIDKPRPVRYALQMAT
ncbi:hypothetical protein GCM10028807_11420 [Spirosoma daeguense]